MNKSADLWSMCSSITTHVMLSISQNRWCPSSAGGGRKPLSHLHGRHHRLRVAWMWPHGDLHQMRKEDERVPHLQAVRGAGRACLQVLKLKCFFPLRRSARGPGFSTEEEPDAATIVKEFFFSRLDCCLWPTFSPLRPTLLTVLRLSTCPPAVPGLPLYTADTDTTLL